MSCDEIKCAPTVLDDDVKVTCDISHQSCHTANEQTKLFYDRIHWPSLHQHMKNTDFMQQFLTTLEKDSLVVSLINELYDFNLENETNILKTSMVESNNAIHCDDITLIVDLYKTAPKGKSKQKCRLFHISLHPEKPKYSLGKRRSLSACGYYEKVAGENNEDNSGPLHYKIDTLQWCAGKGKDLKEDERPYKKLMIENTYRFQTNTDPFSLLDNFTYLDKTKLDQLNELHNIIYNQFVVFWNTTMVSNTFIVPPLPVQTSSRKQKSTKSKSKRKGKNKKKFYSTRRKPEPHRYFTSDTFVDKEALNALDIKSQYHYKNLHPSRSLSLRESREHEGRST